MITKSIAPKFGQKHKDYMSRAKSATISVAEGAVRAGKTIDNISVFAWMLQTGAALDRIHLATGSTAANAKLNIGDANGFGLEYIFRGQCRWTKYKGNEALIIKPRGLRRDYVVIFAGGGKADSFKKIRGNSYGMWIATEINLHHPDTIKEALNRQLAARVRRIFWDLNPSSPGHWIYTDYVDILSQMFVGKWNYEHFTIFDNATISPERLEEIKAQYIPGTVWYRRDILGERCIASGLVYPMFTADSIEADAPRQYKKHMISMDYGTRNPTAMILWGLAGGVWYAYKEFYYNSRSEMSQKTDQEYYDDLCRLAGDLEISQIIIDPSALSFITLVEKKHRFKVWSADNDVLDGIRHTAQCLDDGRIRICEACVNTIKEFGLYSWDDDAPEDKPIKENDHAMDAVRYFVETTGVWQKKDMRTLF